ncbi:MAG: DUF2927 domain-containing protein [Planctomycetota bacterium]|nr:DUF2927 domain-containing protein [Planctomycetota bacterium]
MKKSRWNLGILFGDRWVARMRATGLFCVAFLSLCLWHQMASAQLDQETIRFIEDVLIGTEYGAQGEPQVCYRWETRPRLSTFGDGSHHPTVVQKTVAHINEFLPDNRRIEILPPDDQTATIQLHFVPLKEFETLAEAEGFKVSGSDWGVFYMRWNRFHEIESAVVLIAEDKLRGRRLQHFLLEELTQSLGMAGDSTRFKESVFYEDGGQRQFGTATELSELDRKLIRFLYEHVPAGTSPVELGVFLERFWQQ